MRKPSLLARFSLLSLVAVAVLGGVLAHVLRGQIERRALTNAAQSAVLVSRFGIQPQLFAAELNDGLSSEAVAALDQRLRAGYTSEGVAAVVIFNRARKIVYSSDQRLIGKTASDEPGVQGALKGEVEARVVDGGEAVASVRGRVIEAWAPLRFGSHGPASGAFELNLFYAPVAAQIKKDTHELYVVLLVGLALLWASVHRIASGASRTLRRQAAENEHQAGHDSLTGLPNRHRFYACAEQMIRLGRRYGSSAAVLVIDLDRFKEVNDTLGHRGGDLLLQQAGDRLRGELRDSDTIGRVGGDEFAVLLPETAGAAAVLEVAGRLREALEQPFVLDGLSVHVTGSIGGALYPEHGDSVGTLLRLADVAMYAAKGLHSGCEVYAAEHDRVGPSPLTLLGELRQAVDEEELVLHYQPKVEIATGRVASVEALARWQHPERGLLGPMEFIPVAEQTGMIKPLTSWVLDAALRQCRAWADAGVPLRVAVNLSASNFLDAGLPNEIAHLLDKWGLAPDQLQVEITESTIMSIPARTTGVLAHIHEMGVTLSIDDFGTGYSSLARLQKLPVDELKIDRTFVGNLADHGGDAFIVSSAIDLGRHLGLNVVAEGVETASQWARLAELGCHTAQGYYISRPLPAPELLGWLEAWQPSSGSPAATLSGA